MNVSLILLIYFRYTAGVVGGLSAVAVCAPSDKFLNMGGPLAIGLGVVFVSSLGKYFDILTCLQHEHTIECSV